jgi:hypothetical protein
MPPPEPRFPVRFDPNPWEQDLAHSTPSGHTAAQNARRDYERDGIPVSHLKPCETEGRDGTSLPDCAKVYLPYPDGHFGMVFTIDREVDKPAFVFLAFGVRHHPKGSHAHRLPDRPPPSAHLSATPPQFFALSQSLR